DEEPAGAPAADRDAIGCGVAVRDELQGARDEVVESVALLEKAAVLVPLPPHLATPPHVRDRIHEPAVEEAEPVRIEHRVARRLIGAVAVQQKRSRLSLHVAAVDK